MSLALERRRRKGFFSPHPSILLLPLLPFSAQTHIYTSGSAAPQNLPFAPGRRRKKISERWQIGRLAKMPGAEEELAQSWFFVAVEEVGGGRPWPLSGYWLTWSLLYQY